MTNYQFEPIGVIHSCYREKFGIPRQPRMVRSSRAILKLNPHPQFTQAIRNLEGFTHLWIIFVFHHLEKTGNWKPLIRPPRLGGSKKVGVLASRSPHRPNPIGISAVNLESINWNAKGGAELHLKGIDLLDGTPVLDIKPYIPYADSIPRARLGWEGVKKKLVRVHFEKKALKPIKNTPELKLLIKETLQLDPRPAFQAKLKSPQTYGMRISDFDVHWKFAEGVCRVTEILPTS
jgi:tRNA (adenine37-N6)-methyltransferase